MARSSQYAELLSLRKLIASAQVIFYDDLSKQAVAYRSLALYEVEQASQ